MQSALVECPRTCTIDPSHDDGVLAMFDTLSRWLTMAAERINGRPKLEEVIVSQIIQSRIRFAPYAETREGETPAMRASYRHLVKEPTVKSCLDTLIGGIAQGELDVPAKSKLPRDTEIADFCKDLIYNCSGGLVGLATSVIGNGLIEGYSVSEPVWEIEDRGRWRAKSVLRAVKPKPTDDYWFEVDRFWNVTSIVTRLNLEPYPTSDFIYWRNGNLTNSPHGTSALRSCYRSAWMLDTVWKLRGIGLERYTLPAMIAKYPFGNDSVKRSMEAAVKRIKAAGYATIPQEAMLEPLQMSLRGTSDFEAAVKDLREDIAIAMTGGSLQMLQGFTPGARGSSKEHGSQLDTRVWMLTMALCEIIYRQIFCPAVEWNYGKDAEVPHPVIGGINDDDIKRSLDLDEQLQRMGYPVSISGISERTRRSPGAGDDILKPPGQSQQPGLGGMFGGLGDIGGQTPPGGDNGPASGPPEPPKSPEPDEPDGNEPEPIGFSERNRDRVVVINQLPPGAYSEQRTPYRSFSANDWAGPITGPHGGTYWQNRRTGVKVYQAQNPGGTNEHGQDMTHGPEGHAVDGSTSRVERPENTGTTAPSAASVASMPFEADSNGRDHQLSVGGPRGAHMILSVGSNGKYYVGEVQVPEAWRRKGLSKAMHSAAFKHAQQNGQSELLSGMVTTPESKAFWDSLVASGHAERDPRYTDGMPRYILKHDPMTPVQSNRRNRERPRPEGWGAEPIIPGMPHRIDERTGQPIWNVTTSTGQPRAQPILDDVQRLFRAGSASITDADVQRVVDSIANISGRDALYTVAVALGVPGSMQPAVVAGHVSGVLNQYRPQQPGSGRPEPLRPNITPRAPRAARTPRAEATAPAEGTAQRPAAAATPAAPEKKEPPKFKKTSKAQVRFGPTTEASIKSSMSRIVPNWEKHTEGMTQADAMMTLVGAPDFIKTADVDIRPSGDTVQIRISGPGGLTLSRSIYKDAQGRPHIHNNLFEAGEHKGDGFGLDVFSRQVEAMAAAGFGDISTHAAGDYEQAQTDNGFNGYNTWARFGYDYPIANLYSRTREKAQQKFPNARTVQDIMQAPGGPQWWRVNGSGMGDARFDLTEGSRSRRVLEAYKQAAEAKKAHRDAVMNQGELSAGKIKHDGKEYSLSKVGEFLHVRAPGQQADEPSFIKIGQAHPQYRRLKAHAVDHEAQRRAELAAAERARAEERQRNAAAQAQARAAGVPSSSSHPQGRHNSEHPINHGDLTMTAERTAAMTPVQRQQWRDRIKSAVTLGHVQPPKVGQKFPYGDGEAKITHVATLPDGTDVADIDLGGGRRETNVPLVGLITRGYRPSVLKPDDLTPGGARNLAWQYRISDAMSSGELKPMVGHEVGRGTVITAIDHTGEGGRLRFTTRDTRGNVRNSIRPGELVEQGWRPPNNSR